MTATPAQQRALLLLFDSAIKFTNIQPVVDSFRQLGFLPNWPGWGHVEIDIRPLHEHL